MSAALPPSLLGARFERAVAAAIAAHRHRRRASSDVPHIAHRFGVCAVVLENGGSESEAIAALLLGTHIRDGFGDDVAAILEGCTDAGQAGADPAPFYDRTLAAIERLRQHTAGDQSVFLVSAADTLYDARVTNDGLLRDEDVFARMAGKKFGTLWAYRAFADAYREHGGRHLPFAGALAELVDAMAGKPVTTAELLAAFSIDDGAERREKGSLSAEGAAR